MGILIVFLQGLLEGFPLGIPVGITTWIPKWIPNGNPNGIPPGFPKGKTFSNPCGDWWDSSKTPNRDPLICIIAMIQRNVFLKTRGAATPPRPTFPTIFTWFPFDMSTMSLWCSYGCSSWSYEFIRFSDDLPMMLMMNMMMIVMMMIDDSWFMIDDLWFMVDDSYLMSCEWRMTMDNEWWMIDDW